MEWAAVPVGLVEWAEDPVAAVEVLEKDLVGAVQDLGQDLDDPFSASSRSTLSKHSSYLRLGVTLAGFLSIFRQ